MPEHELSQCSGPVLLHICCGPCAVWPVEALRTEGVAVTGFWYNPNIHPLREYRERLASCRRFARLVNLPLLEDDEYGLEQFLKATFPARSRRPQRCEACYRLRLGGAARAAGEARISAYTTTLLVSPYQDQKMIVAIGEDEGRRHGVEFLHRHFQQGFRAGRQKSRVMGLYQQSYCGCLFSEAESYGESGSERGGCRRRPGDDVPEGGRVDR